MGVLSYLVTAWRVWRGARAMDHSSPRWYERVDLHKLDLSCSVNCILGQSVGDYVATGHQVLGLLSYSTEGRRRGVVLGFLKSPWSTWDDLKALWVQQIEQRIAAG